MGSEMCIRDRPSSEAEGRFDALPHHNHQRHDASTQGGRESFRLNPKVRCHHRQQGMSKDYKNRWEKESTKPTPRASGETMRGSPPRQRVKRAWCTCPSGRISEGVAGGGRSSCLGEAACGGCGRLADVKHVRARMECASGVVVNAIGSLKALWFLSVSAYARASVDVYTYVSALIFRP